MITKKLCFTSITKGVAFTVLFVLYLLFDIIGTNSGYSGSAAEAGLNPSIKIEPGTSVEVGEEVFFSATESTYSDKKLLQKARYEWDFGDGYYHRYDPAGSAFRQGIAVTHYYMRPGNFTVKLKTTIWTGWNENGSPLSITATSTDSVEKGTGTKHFKIEPGKALSTGMKGIVKSKGAYDGMHGTVRSYNPVTGELIVDVTKCHGKGTFNEWVISFETIPLAQAESAVSIHVAGEAPIAGFEIQRAPFHNRLAQYLYVQIPGAYRRNQTVLHVTLKGASGSNNILLSKNNLSAEEKVFLDHKPLVKDDYVVIAELVDAKGNRIPGGIWRDKFSKRYNGIPKVGIDENNAFRVKDELFFPMSPYMIGKSEYPIYISKAGINTVNTEGYSPTHTPSSWSYYVDQVEAYNLMAIGPGRGDYSIGVSPNRWRFNHNPDRMAEYVRKSKDKPMMFAWIWQDEPNLGGKIEKVYPPTFAAWAYVCHREDSQHPAYNLFLGNDWSRRFGKDTLNPNDYFASAPLFGGKKWMQDVFSLDAYPIASRAHSSLNFADMGPYAAYLDLLDRARLHNKDLTPLMPAVQPCQGNSVKAWPSVTEKQLYMETWLNVIHGAKGIVWFNYFDMANSARWASMKKFADQIKVLTPVVLGPAPARTVTTNANVALNRVDTMIREKDGNIYIFTARVTEPDPVPQVKYQGVEPESITVNFKVSGLAGSALVEVIDEGHQISLTDGLFTDKFGKNAVHIYKIANQSIRSK